MEPAAKRFQLVQVPPELMYIGWEKASFGSGKVNFTCSSTVLVSLVVTHISAVLEQESQSNTHHGVISIP